MTVSASVPEQAVGCYCCLLEQETSPEQPDADGNGYVICFMGGSEKGLNLYPSLAHGLFYIVSPVKGKGNKCGMKSTHVIKHHTISPSIIAQLIIPMMNFSLSPNCDIEQINQSIP